MQIRDMQESDRAAVLEMVQAFYHSDAVDHAVSPDLLNQVFTDSVAGHTMLRGVVLLDAETVIGFAYLSWYYACEVAGMNLMIEEVFLKEAYRGRGYGTEFFTWVFKEYPQAKRYRMEVTDANESAVKLYKKLGFAFLDYRQMVKDIGN